MAKPVRIAVIGKRNQAARHIKILKTLPHVNVIIYHPSQSTPFANVLKSDGVIISSPTPTHNSYLAKLKSFKGFVLIEKPAVSTAAQSKALLKWPAARKAKTRVNFNLRHSRLWSHVDAVLKSGRLGKLISLDIHTSHGLAFKPAYQKSWRGKAGATRGVIETVGVHYINLCLNFFGRPQTHDLVLDWNAGKKGPADTAVLRLSFKNGPRVSLRHSYAAPYLHRWLLVGTNGYWDYDGETAKLHGPRNTFDKNGRFSNPPVVRQERLPQANVWTDSLKAAVSDFVAVVRRKGRFSPAEFDAAVRSMEPLYNKSR
jgi:predicted dehydrogenase